ncbi:MAG: hypothetical protein KA239_00640 [Bacteroidia bacterium]|nr:hypothetical protein [Bacteroidia bacterium]
MINIVGSIFLLTTLLPSCGDSARTPSAPIGPSTGYIDYAVDLLEERLDSASWKYAQHWFDSAGRPIWQPSDSDVTVISGMNCIGKFSCYPMMMSGELFEGNILGDSSKERLLLLQDHLSLTMYGGFHFCFYSHMASSGQPNAIYEFYAEELKDISFRPVSDPTRNDLVLQFEQSHSTYMNKGMEIIRIELDTAFQIFSQLTAFYDWKDYGKGNYFAEYGQEKLEEDEGYRETSEIVFSDENEDGIQEIDVVTIAEIVADTMPMDIQQLKPIRKLSTNSCRFEYHPKAKTYLSKVSDCN